MFTQVLSLSLLFFKSVAQCPNVPLKTVWVTESYSYYSQTLLNLESTINPNPELLTSAKFRFLTG